MDNNLARNRFFSGSIQLDFIADTTSLKEIVCQQLHYGILEKFANYSDEHQSTDFISRKIEIDQVLTSLPDKVILTKPKEASSSYLSSNGDGRVSLTNSSADSSLVYSCAIAFPLAHLYSLTSLQVAQELVAGLASNSPHSPEQLKLQFTVKVLKNGLIEFTLGDRSIGWWLELVKQKLEVFEEYRVVKKIAGDFNLFPLQYVYQRCCSLLRLGAREGLINLKDNDFPDNLCSNSSPGFKAKFPLIWSIANSNPFQYYSEQNINYSYQPAELNLLRQIAIIIDYRFSLIRNRTMSLDLAVWYQLHLNLSNACLQFIAACRIFGSVARNNRSLAIARLGLIAIVQCYLYQTKNGFS